MTNLCPDCGSENVTASGADHWTCDDCAHLFTAVRGSALDVQTGGDHYKSQAIQPIEYIHANGLGFCEGNVIKYVTRFRNKNGIEDLKKARHYLDLLIELEYSGE